jgi:hypothetical protein
MVEYIADQPSVHDMQLLFAKKRLAELQAAVRWERECDEELTRALFHDPSINDVGFLELRDIYQAACMALNTLAENN